MKRWIAGMLLLAVVIVGGRVAMTNALTVTDSGNVPVTAVVPGPPPTIPAIINSPPNNKHVTTTPLVVSGTCGPLLIVRVFDNSQLAGSVACAPDGTFVMNITLDAGSNILTALNYDTLDQAGPASASVRVIVDKPTSGTTSGGSRGGTSLNELETLPSNSRQSFLKEVGIGIVFWIVDPTVKVNPWLNWLVNIIILTAVILLIVFAVRRRRKPADTTFD